MTFIAIGGAEDKEKDMVVLRRVLSESGIENPRVHVITTASNFPDDMRKMYEDAFKKLGFDNYRITYINSRAMAKDPALVAGVTDTDIVFFSGGDQLRLTALLGGTPFMKAVKQGHEDDSLIVSGTSAGAAAACDVMIYGGDAKKAMNKGVVDMTAGLGFVDGVTFDTHFGKRERLARLFNVVSMNPGVIGVGLDEDTGVIAKNGILEVTGTQTVTIVDGHGITRSNISDIKSGEKIETDGIVTHVLRAGDRYDVKNRVVIPKQ